MSDHRPLTGQDWSHIHCYRPLVVVGKTAIHRRLGILGAALAAVFLLEGYLMSVEAARRGFDLSRTVNAQADPLGALVTRLGFFFEFGALVLVALCYRRRPEIHRRLLLLATVGPIAVAPIAHFVHQWIRPDEAGLVKLATAVMTILLLSSSAIIDGVSRRRIHAISLWVPIVLFVWQVQVAAVFPARAAIREFAAWLIR